MERNFHFKLQFFKLTFLLLIIFAISCNRTDNSSKIIQDTEIKNNFNFKLKRELKYEISKCIKLNSINSDCKVYIYYHNLLSQNISLFNVVMSDLKKETNEITPIFVTKVDGHEVLFYSGLERYIEEIDDKNFKNDNKADCNSGTFLIKDSSGIYTLYPDLLVVPDCRISIKSAPISY